MDFSVETLRPGDRSKRHALGNQAFGGTEPFDEASPTFSADEIVAAYDGDDLLGSVITLDFGQTFGGRSLPCGGVSGVVVAPEARGRGVAKTLLAESFARMTHRGQVISALYPTTSTLYRSMGFEVAGWFMRRAIPLGLAPADRLDRWERVSFDDPRLRQIDETMASQHDGSLHLGDDFWAFNIYRATNDAKSNRFAYVGHRGNQPVAAVQYHYTRSDSRMYELETEIAAGVDGDALASVFGFLASNGTTASEIRTTTPAHLLAPHVAHLQHTKVIDDWPWMLRLVDVAAAMAGRGWSPAVTARLSFDVADAVLARNAGPATLEVTAGSGSWTPGGPGTIGVSVQDLAALFSGYADARVLVDSGRLPGATDHDVDVMRAVFAGHPALADFF